MKRLLLLTLFPALAFAALPNCADLGGIVQRLERDVNDLYSLERCSTRQVGSGITDCMNVGALTVKLRQLENSRALLLGIEKLKNDIHAKRLELVGKKPTRANAMSFGEAVITAQSLELLSKTMDGSKSLLPAIKAAMTTNIPTLSLVKAVQYACARRTAPGSAQDACSNLFSPTPRAIEELGNLVKATDITPELLTRWQNALKIKKADGSDYDFIEMRADYDASIGASGKGALTQVQIASLKQIPDFTSAPGLEFLDDVNSGKISAGRGDEFRNLLSDLTGRQKAEVQSSTSLGYYTYKDELGSVAGCSEAKSDYAKATQCMSSMRAALDSMANQVHKTELTRLLDTLDTTKNYLGTIDTKTPDCMSAISTAIQSTGAVDLKACSDLVSLDQADIENEITNVTSLRNKILQENDKKVLLRDYAVSKFQETCSPQTSETILQSCDSGFTPTFSKDMLSLTADAFDISIMIAKQDEKKPDIEIGPICKDPVESKKPEARRLCDLDEAGDVRPETPKPNPPHKPEPVNSVSPKAREEHPVHDAFVVGFGNFTRMLAANYAQNNYAQPYVSPYGLYSPYAASNYPTFSSFSDSIMYPSYASGAYSFYSAYTPVIPPTSFYAGGLSWSTPSTSSTTYPSYFNFK